MAAQIAVIAVHLHVQSQEAATIKPMAIPSEAAKRLNSAQRLEKAISVISLTKRAIDQF